MLHWNRIGKGPDVVLVHGFLGSSQIFEPLTNHLAQNFTVTTIDLPGCAGSFDIPVPSTVEKLSEMVAETIRSSGVDKCSILGHSLGAWIALELSIQQPDLLHKVVLYGGSPDGFCPERFETYENSIERIRAEGIETFAANLAAEWFRYGKEDPMYSFVKKAGCHSNEAAAIHHVQSWNNWKARDRLDRVKATTLVVCGDCDRSTHPDLSIEMWKKISESQLFIIPNSGHAAHLESTEVFNEIVFRFLDQ